MSQQVDKFQPLAIVQKLDAMRQEFTEYSAHYFTSEFVEGVKFALIWARVEVLSMACAKDRYIAEDEYDDTTF